MSVPLFLFQFNYLINIIILILILLFSDRLRYVKFGEKLYTKIVWKLLSNLFQ